MSECNSCGAEIKWMKTANDKNIPVDVPPIEDPLRDEVMEATLFDRERFKTHFETCPNAAKHRQPRTKAPEAAGSESVIARKLDAAIAIIQDIAGQSPDGMRAVQLAKAGLSQIREIR